ncbi:MAG: rhomboid family intramembrane serine protease [Gammaproteobacteria bacterium]|nr:rhomboid family intramembrane serine protease [Gammaproteobacteria bacterium]
MLWHGRAACAVYRGALRGTVRALGGRRRQRTCRRGATGDWRWRRPGRRRGISASVDSRAIPCALLTYGFLHGGISHILFNMYGLYLFGAEIERHWGEKRFLNYYMTCVLSAGLAQLVTASLSGAVYPTWGASGGVFGVLMAYGLMFPSRIILPLFPPIPMRAMTFVMVYGAIELFLGVSGTQQGVAHFAHLGGMLGGYLLYRRWTAGSPRR